MSDFVMSSRQAAELDHAFERAGFTPQEVKVLSSGDLLASVRQVVLGFAVIMPVETKPVDPGTFRFTVDHGQTLEQMIAAGCYDWKNGDITAKRFPINGEGVVEYEARYFNFDRNTSSEDNIAAMKEAGWEPAEIKHLLAHGKTSPDEQRKFPIVALGSVAEVVGSRYVPCLGEGGSGRGLRLDWFGLDWSPVCRFLAVRKVSVS